MGGKITGGIDVGLCYTKAVVLQDGLVAGRAIGESGGAGRAQAVQAVWQDALREAHVSSEEVAHVVATGKGRLDAHLAHTKVTEPMAAARAARVLLPNATALVDIGADETLVVILAEDGHISEMVINEKCAAGPGLLIELTGQRLGLGLDEMNTLDVTEEISSLGEGTVSDGCAVFAEMDGLGLLNRGATPRQVAAALILSVAVRASATLNEITLHRWERVVLAGGMARNSAFVQALRTRSNISFEVPVHAQYASALGAAWIATDSARGNTDEK